MLLLKVGDQALGNTPKKKDPSFCPMSECNVRYFTSVKFQKPFDSFFALFVALICKSENVCFNLFFEFFLIKEFVKVVDGVSTPHLFQVNVSSSNLFSNKLQIPQLLLILCSKSAMTTLNRVHLSHPLFKLRDQKFILLVFFQFWAFLRNHQAVTEPGSSSYNKHICSNFSLNIIDGKDILMSCF